MILRKPYAFFIKMFKPIHLVIGLLIGYLMIGESKIFDFLDKNITTNLNLVGHNIKSTYVSTSLYLIPVILILLFISILTIMFYKKKPITFYLVSIFGTIAVLVINIYAINFFDVVNTSIVAVKTTKLIHDLVFISMLVEGILLIFVIIRGFGVNIQKFNFDSDISKIDIKDSDNEEFELNIRLNIDKTRREHNRRIRYLKYAYAENKLIVNIVVMAIIAIIGVITWILLSRKPKMYTENFEVYTSTCSIIVENSYIVNKSYDGRKLTDNYLIVVDAKVRGNYKNAEIFLNDFNIDTKNIIYTPTTMYNKYLIDLGKGFSIDKVNLEYSNFIFVYEIPEKYINKNLVFSYNDGQTNSYIKLTPKKINYDDTPEAKSIGEKLAFEDKLTGISFTINSFDIQDKFKLNYKYCMGSNDCLNSIEYVKASINKNYDKSVIKLNIDFKNESEFKYKFYNLLTTFGYIEYKLNEDVKIEKNIELVTSNRVDEKNVIYLGVNKEIMNAEEITFAFNVRGRQYTYKVK